MIAALKEILRIFRRGNELPVRADFRTKTYNDAKSGGDDLLAKATDVYTIRVVTN